MMSAFRLDGGRVFYVEHECTSAKSENPNKKHQLHSHVHNPVYIVRMFFRGDLDVMQSSVDEFAYMTDGVMGQGGVDAYVNCPLCGSEGRVITNKKEQVEIKEAFGGRMARETPFR
ncbi:hypothetical protein [Methanocella sp. MCL-LM]|uniref:hypothetical protein n=1 Tax=Methanocella sp. MCL-LM TaxID=3412035 RepID=UPI003C78B0DF